MEQLLPRCGQMSHSGTHRLFTRMLDRLNRKGSDKYVNIPVQTCVHHQSMDTIGHGGGQFVGTLREDKLMNPQKDALVQQHPCQIWPAGQEACNDGQCGGQDSDVLGKQQLHQEGHVRQGVVVCVKGCVKGCV